MPPKKASNQAKGNPRESSVKSSVALTVTPDWKDTDVEYVGKVITPKKLHASRISDYFPKTPPKPSLLNTTSAAKFENSQGILKIKNAVSPAKSSPSKGKKLLRLRERKGNVRNCNISNVTRPITSFYGFEPSPGKQEEGRTQPTMSCVVRLFDCVKSEPCNANSSCNADNQPVVKIAAMRQRSSEIKSVEQTKDQKSETSYPVEPHNMHPNVKRKSVSPTEAAPKKRTKSEHSFDSNSSAHSYKLRSLAAKDSSANLASPAFTSSSSTNGSLANFTSREIPRSSGSLCNGDRKTSRKISKDELTVAAQTFRSTSRTILPANVTEKYPICESIESLFIVTCKSNYYQALRILHGNLNANCYPRVSCMEVLIETIILGQQAKSKCRQGGRNTSKETPHFSPSSRYEFVTACELLNSVLALHPPSVVPSLDSIYRRLLYGNEETAYEGWNKLENLLLDCDFDSSDHDSLNQIMASIPQLPERQWFALRWFVRVLETDLQNTLAVKCPSELGKRITTHIFWRKGTNGVLKYRIRKPSELVCDVVPNDLGKNIVTRIFWHAGTIGVVNYRIRRLVEILRDALIGDKRRALEEAMKLLSFVAIVIHHVDSSPWFPFQLSTLSQDLVRCVADCLQSWANQSCDNMNEALHALKPAWLRLAICQRWLTELDRDWNLCDAIITLSTVFSRYLAADASYPFGVGETLDNPALKLQALPPVLQACVRRFLVAYQEHFGIRDILAILVQGASCAERNESATSDFTLSENEYQHLLKDLKIVKSCKLLPTDCQSSEGVGLLVI